MQIFIHRNNAEGLLGYNANGDFTPLHIIQDNMFKLYDKSITSINYDKNLGYQIIPIQTADGIPTYQLKQPAQQVIAMRGGGGGGGIRGINVQDEGIQFGGQFITLNFAGANVTVTDDGSGKATVTVGGGGMITGGGTVNRIAMFTGANTIGDSPFLRSGSDVTADGFIYFNSGNGIDVVASGGADILNIGTTNADVINYGYAGTTHNMNGTVFNVFTTNLNVTDKIITLNDGGAGGSGGNVGFEIEEGGVATGYFIQNATRNGFDFQASAITGVVTFSLANVTANRTATLQDASGTLAYLSDIPVNAFIQNGNSFGANAVLGTNDAFSLSFETSGVTRETISATGLFGINTAPVAGTLVTVQSTGTTSATWIEQWYNSNGAPVPTTILFGVRDDGYITAGLINGSMTIGLGSGFISTVASNTFIGVDIASTLTTGTQNTALGHQPLNALTSGNNNVAIGVMALSNTETGLRNIGIGVNSNFTNISSSDNISIGDQALFANTGQNNLAIGTTSLFSNTTGEQNIGIGFQTLYFNATGSRNVVIGYNAGIANANLSDNIFLGYNSAFFETGSNKLMIDNQARIDQGDARAKSLVYGKFAGTTPLQSFNVNGNVGIGLGSTDNSFGTGADFVLGIMNGGTEVSTAIANGIQIYSVDSGDATATLGLFLEQAVEAVGTFTGTNKIKVKINGVLYWIELDAV